MTADTLSEADVVDATAIDEPEPTPRPRATEQASVALAVRERRSEVIRPLDPDELVASFNAYQDLLGRLLTPSDYQSTGDDRFVTKSGWLKIAAAFDLDVQILRSNITRDPGGSPERAEVWARAIAPSGRAMDGDGYCDLNEKRFNTAAGRQRLENDLRTTATTRAFNRAISGLIGMGDPDEHGGPAGPAVAGASPELVAATREHLALLFDGDLTAGEGLTEHLARYFGGELPSQVGQALVLVARAIKPQGHGS